jgi:predicted phosphodiesterase
MTKKINWLTYVRGSSFLVALVFLFVVLLSLSLGAGHHPLSGPALQGKEGVISSNSFQFAVLSDSHRGWGKFMPIMKEIAKDGYSFAVHGGDFVSASSEDQYRFFFKKLAEVRGKTPLYFIPGNHDTFKEDGTYSAELFRSYCGPDHYWFSWGNAAFVVLNDAQSIILDDEFRWLESTLRELRGRGTFTHLFVFMHVPPFDPREDNSYCLQESDGEKFMALMEKYRVAYVFSGHIHCYFRKVINGVTYIICGGAGGGLKCANGFFHYVRISVEDKKIEDSVIKVKNDGWLQLKGDIQYELRVRNPFLLPLTVVMGIILLLFSLLFPKIVKREKKNYND